MYKADGDKKEMLRLSKIFNGELGKEYQLVSRLEAMSLVLKHHQDPSLTKKMVVALKDLKLPPTLTQIEDYIIQKSKELNNKAKRFL